MADNPKDTIYIDIDDEITGIIDKVRASDSKVVALVLPKRAAVLQSIVNMKLLKRASDDLKRNVVLITSEAGLMPLAGMVGLHVAKSLTSKPEIPVPPPKADDGEETVDEAGNMDDADDFDTATAAATPVGALAGMAAAKDDGVETVELDNDELPITDHSSDDAGAEESLKPKKEKKPKKDKSLKVPNFERFRLLLIVGALVLILLIGGVIYAISALPKATIDVQTNASNVNIAANLNLNTNASSLDPSTDTVPATLGTVQKTYSQQVATTGQKNEGNTASGSVTMTATACAPNLASGPPDVPAGSGLSANGLTYITQVDTSFSFDHFTTGSCAAYKAAGATAINAQNPGSNYNTTGNVTFTVAGRSDVSASSSSGVTGGTDNIVQTVSQDDINNAKAKISANDSTGKQQVIDQLQGQGLYPVQATFSASTPNVSNSANVGTAASNVTVTENITYTMFGVHKADLDSIITSNVDNQINTSKQSILSDGLSDAAFSVQNSSATNAQVSMQVTAEVGPQLNVTSIKKDTVGLKSGEVKTSLQSIPGVTNVNVKLSPFWVTTVPKKLNRITVTIAKPNGSANANNSSNAGNP